ncbi:hypothetical protein K7X08_008605 [Anisodus acutangulus]|uniref:Uncharacterized protein n=1 Tax=Anisodus acutangulus TaxID=402998 RepID=A0A9Q1RP12_9SOLA|nr:hypothetical protein K7X08_008605 [Anisodus acutangulus]
MNVDEQHGIGEDFTTSKSMEKEMSNEKMHAPCSSHKYAIKKDEDNSVVVEVVGDEASKVDLSTTMAIVINSHAPNTLLKKNFHVRSLHDLLSYNIPAEEGTKLIDDPQEAVLVEIDENFQDKLK